MDLKDKPKGMDDVAVVLGAPDKGASTMPMMQGKDDNDGDEGGDYESEMSPEFEHEATKVYQMAQAKGSSKEFVMALHDAIRCFLDNES